MTDPLIKLAARCEAATGGDRELDADIFRALGMPLPDKFFNLPVALSWDDMQRCFLMPAGPGLQIRYEHPAYTSSIDTVMKLAPPNRSVIQYWIVGKKLCVSIQGIDENEPDVHANANTKELALLAAFLQTRAHLQRHRE